MTGKAESLRMPALGRPFRLGMLYDCRKDELVPAMTLWDSNMLHKNINRSPQPSTHLQILMEDSLEQKATALSVEAELKLSFLGGLVSVSGSAEYMHDRRTSLRQSRVTLQYRCTTKFEQLSMEHLGRSNTQHPHILDDDIATHVVTGITYGGEAFLVFDFLAESSDDAVRIKGKLNAAISLMVASVGVTASATVSEEDKKVKEQTKCTFYGDFRPSKNPLTYADAIEVYRELPTMLGADGANSVPKFVWLCPLSKLDSKTQQIVREISNGLVSDTVEIMEELQTAKIAAEDLLRAPINGHFAWLKQDIKSCFGYICEYEVDFRKKLAKILPSIRGASKEEIELSDLIALHRASPFNNLRLTTWIESKAEEQKILDGYLKNIQRAPVGASEVKSNAAVLPVKICNTRADLMEVVNNLETEHVICLNFCVESMQDPMAETLNQYVNAQKSLGNDSDSRSAEMWFNNPRIMSKMRRDVKMFLKFFEDNYSSSKTRFVVAQSSEIVDKDSGSNLVLYKDGIPTPFEPPGQITGLAATDITCSSVTVRWIALPSGDSSEQLICFYRTACPDNPGGPWSRLNIERHGTEAIVKELLSNTDYEFKLLGCCGAGNGKESKVLGPVRTDKSTESSSLAGNAHHRGIPKGVSVISHLDVGNGVTALAISQKNSIICTAQMDGSIGVWKVLAGIDGSLPVTLEPALQRKITGTPGRSQRYCKLIENERSVLTQGTGKNIYIWDLERGIHTGTFSGAEGDSVVISPDGRTCIVSGTSAAIQVWDLTTYSMVAMLPGHSQIATGVGYDRDGHVLSGALDKSVRRWDLRTKQQFWRRDLQAEVRTLISSPVSDWYAAAMATTIEFGQVSSAKFFEHTLPTSATRWFGDPAASGDWFGFALHSGELSGSMYAAYPPGNVHEAPGGKPMFIPGQAEPLLVCAIAEDCSFVAVGGESNQVSICSVKY